MRKYIVLLLLFCLHTAARGQTVEEIDLLGLPQPTQAKSLRYWFDSDKSSLKTVNNLANKQTVDASELSEGLHTIHYQIVDNANTVGETCTGVFVKIGQITATSPKTLLYSFDNEAGVRQMSLSSGTMMLDVSALEIGLHVIHYQVEYGDGMMTPPMTSMFIHTHSDGETSGAKSFSYWFDNEQNAHTANVVGGIHLLDVSALSDGIHTVYYQITDASDMSGAPVSSMFIRTGQQSAKSVRYWFDNQPANARQAELSEVMILDATELSEGSHYLYCQLVADDGEVFPIVSESFNRWFYDIYVSELTEYTDSAVSSNPLFTGKPSLKLHYTTDDVNVRGHLEVDEGTTMSLSKFVQTANWGCKSDDSKYTKAGTDYYHPTTLLNNGFMRADSVMVKQDLYRDRWHFISLPFNVNVCDIEVPEGTYWALRSYDGEALATGLRNETWRNLKSGDQMEAGRGYIIQLTKEGEEKTSRLTFKAINDTKKNKIFSTGDVAVPLEEHQSEFPHNRNWNLTGNPYPCFFDTRCLAQKGTIIVWNGNGYSAYSLSDDSYILMPFEAFFIQKPLTADAITFGKEGRQHTYDVLPMAKARRAAGANRRCLNFILSDGTNTDRSRVVINEQASMGYETDKDAPKFMEDRPQMLQLFSVDGGVQYAINERPEGDGHVTFSLFVPVDGEYHFSVEGDTSNLTLLDTETGTIWALADGDYVFTATAGHHNARLVVTLTSETTAIAQVRTCDDGEIKVTDGRLAFSFMRDKRIKVFGLDGRTLFNNTVSHANINVARGVYVVDIEGKTMKIMVK